MKLKGAGFLPIFVIALFFNSAFSEKLVEVSVQITKLRFLPSASSDTRGFARLGQRFVVDAESGPWYRIRLYNSVVWISKDAVMVLENTEARPSAPVVKAKPPTPSTPGQISGTQPQTIRSGSGPGTPAALQPAIQTAEASTTPASAASDSLKAAALEATDSPAVSQTPLSRPTPTFRPGRPSYSSGQYAAKQQKKEVKPTATRTWFSQFSGMPQVPSGETGNELGFFQIVTVEASVVYWPETSAMLLVKAKKGDFFVARETTDTWCKIVVRDTAGWVLRVKGSLTDKPRVGRIDEFQVILAIAAFIIIIALVTLLVLLIRRRTRGKPQRIEAFHAFIIAKMPPNIQCIISNKTISLEKYLQAIGFSVRTVHDLAAAHRHVAKAVTDIVFIDWNISDDIPGTVEVLFANFEEQKQPLAIFFNVPDLSSIPLIPVLLRAYHLGASFSDHDISKLITPTILSKTSPKTGAGSALEGDIAEGNLPEILQFIEIGKKSGCLLIETTSPLGMIYFNQGRIVHAAAANNLQSKDAINSLLGLTQGHFRFLLNKEPKTMDLNLSTLEVLMEWTKAEDEAHRG
jgi:hypothetical protein